MLKVLFTTSLSLGALSITDSYDSKYNVEAAYKFHLEDIRAAYQSPAKNAFRSVVTIGGEAENMDDFGNPDRHPVVYTIQNSSGTVVQRGSLNAWNPLDNPLYNKWEYTSTTNISVANLVGGNYRLKISIHVDDGAITSVDDADLTQAFTINGDRSISNIRP